MIQVYDKGRGIYIICKSKLGKITSITDQTNKQTSRESVLFICVKFTLCYVPVLNVRGLLPCSNHSDSWMLMRSPRSTSKLCICRIQTLQYMNHLLHKYRGIILISGGSRNFKTGGCSSGAVEFLGMGFCLEATSHIPYVFVVRVVNKIHVVNIVSWLKSKFMRVIQSEFTPKPRIFFQTGGRASTGSAFAYSWEPMFVDCQNFATSWGRNFVGN